jgi:hypothetical protein
VAAILKTDSARLVRAFSLAGRNGFAFGTEMLFIGGQLGYYFG